MPLGSNLLYIRDCFVTSFLANYSTLRAKRSNPINMCNFLSRLLPKEATVLVNGKEEGTTPLTLRLKKSKEYTIEFVKDGFKTKSLRMTYGLGAGWLILDILSGLVGIIVDAATGNWNSFDYDSYRAVLKKAE